MIRLSGLSFGYGVRFGPIYVISEQYGDKISREKHGVAVTYPLRDGVRELREIANVPGVDFIIFPLCSSYSHLASSMWSSPVPTMALAEHQKIIHGAHALVDFDEGLLWMAESQSEIEVLRNRARCGFGLAEGVRESSTENDANISPVAVLAEATGGMDFLQALADGADGLSVVRIEELLRNRSCSTPESTSLIEIVKTRPEFLPLLVRFYDHDSDVRYTDGAIPAPCWYLGYRGIRILEIDDTAVDSFRTALRALNVDSISVILPMVTSLAEVRRVRNRLGAKWKIGVTVETPAAALGIRELLEISSYVQIGLNDLTQYTMAWDRDIPNVERLPPDRIVEPVADLIALVANCCTQSGVEYTLGLDLRPTRRLASQIRSLGVNSISCPPPLVGPWKKALGCETG